MRRVLVVAATLVSAVTVWLLGAGPAGAAVTVFGCVVTAMSARIHDRREHTRRVHYVPGYHRNG